jgi:transposase
LPQALAQATLEVYLEHLDESVERLAKLNARLEELAVSHEQAPLIQAFACLYGVALVTAITLVAELGDLSRFPTARALMGYIGLGPREHSSGGRVRRGGISKRGHSHVRRVVVEASWHYRRAPGVGPALQRRRRHQPAGVLTIADKAHARLHRRYRKLVGRGKLPQVAVVAVARELLGFVWAIARELVASRAAATPAPTVVTEPAGATEPATASEQAA